MCAGPWCAGCWCAHGAPVSHLDGVTDVGQVRAPTRQLHHHVLGVDGPATHRIYIYIYESCSTFTTTPSSAYMRPGLRVSVRAAHLPGRPSRPTGPADRAGPAQQREGGGPAQTSPRQRALARDARSESRRVLASARVRSWARVRAYPGTEGDRAAASALPRRDRVPASA